MFFDIIKRRYWYFGLSLLIIVPGLIALALWGLPLAIDFTGGTLLEVQAVAPTRPLEAALVRELYTAQGIADPVVQISTDNTLVIRSQDLGQEQQQAILTALENAYGEMQVLSATTVGPSVGQEVAQQAGFAIAAAAIGILLYISFAFRRVPHALRYGICAIMALTHDLLLVLGLAAIAGKFLGWQVDALFLTAVLTVAGFSVHDTIVVFDRIRENLVVYRRLDYETVVNHSIVQTLDRSINTQLTVMFTLLALALFGGDTIRHFVITLLVGIFSGTYSSIFNAAALLVVWENREWRFWGRGKQAATA
jgi:preprotein translocase subunit SecF